jgi:hypothetical protein
MRGLCAVLLLTGCAPSFEGRASHAVTPGDAPDHGPAGTVGVGFAIESDRGSVAEYVELGRSRLRAGAPAAIFGAGVRLDHVIDRDVPWLRGYGRLSLGSAGERAPLSNVSLGVGVAWLHAFEELRTSLGLGVVYEYAEDEMTGAGDFVGLELDLALHVGRTTDQQIERWLERKGK